MTLTATTKKYKSLYIIFTILSIASTILPLLIYIIKGYVESEITVEKVTLTCTLLLALILTIVNVLFKYKLRSIIWILLLGIYICIDNILTLIIMIGVLTILDEFIFTPLKESFKNKYVINKEMDKRL